MPPPVALPDDAALAELTGQLGHAFRRPGLLKQALTHASVTRGRAGANDSYERLEFLGDRVLGLIVADLLLARFPEESEGALARRLAALVRRETLAEVAEEIGLGAHIVLGPGENPNARSENLSLLADVCEAVIGALYLDGGLDAARGFVERLWRPRMAADPTPPQDAKTALQEWAQGRGLALPAYREVDRAGPPHEPLFTVEVAVEGEAPATGRGRSKRMAEQAAAEDLMERLAAGSWR